MGLVCWFHPTKRSVGPDAAFEDATVFPRHLLCLYTTFRKPTGLTERDLDLFVKEDILGTYGAQAFMLRFTDLLLEARGLVYTDRHVDNVDTCVDNVRKILAHPECRQYYTSSGFIRALCDLADNPRLSQYNESLRWGIHRSVLKMVEYVRRLTGQKSPHSNSNIVPSWRPRRSAMP